MSEIQKGILAPPPGHARYLFFNVVPGHDLAGPLKNLRDRADGDRIVVGFGLSLIHALDCEIEGLVTAPHYAGAGFDVPSTPAALWCWLRGEDRGELLQMTRGLARALMPAFRLDHVIDAFRYGPGLDLTGYEDGTENPKGDAATAAAAVSGKGRGLDGGSFVAVQQWQHDMRTFDAMSAQEQDNSMGRRRSDNEELSDAPPSSHVKRTAQESFEPEAFVLRRSMPWIEGERAGLVFVAFGRSFYAFDVQLRRMVGVEDGIPDALFKFTRPISGAYFWCPPQQGDRLDLSALGLEAPH